MKYTVLVFAGVLSISCLPGCVVGGAVRWSTHQLRRLDDHDHSHETNNNITADASDIWNQAWADDDQATQEAHDDHDHGEDGDHDDSDHGDHDHQQEGNAVIDPSLVTNKPWGAAIGAALLVNLMTLVGVIVFIPVAVFGRRFSLSSSAKECILHITIPSFACGALLATAVYLLIPESFALLAAAGADHSGHDHRVLQDDHEEHGDAWKAGTAILGGYFLPYLMQAFFPHPHVPGDIAVHTTDDRDDANQLDSKKDSSDTDGDEEVKVTVHENMDHIITAEEDPVKDDDTPAITKIASIPDYSLAVSILAGDFFHNFCDGIFIGTAFLLCSRDVAITVTATTVFHELSQELADFFLLTGECHFPIWKALLLNFISGLSVVLGVIVIFASDVNDTTIAILLAMSAGVYLFIALTECAPRVNSYVTSLRRRLLSFLFWVLGAVPIGLVLLNHNHCD